MLDLALALLHRAEQGHRVAVVTVTRVARSAPRGLGASMAITDEGEVIGSISGGCVEGDSVSLAYEVITDGRARTARFGFDDDTAHAAGLACGGQVDVIAYLVTPDMHAVLREAAADRAVTVGLALDGPEAGSLAAHPDLGAAALLRETRILEAPETLTIARDSDDPAGSAREPAHRQSPAPRVLALSRAPRPRLILAGATEHAAALCRVGAAAGYAVTVVDPWAVLATPERFPDAAEIAVDMPDAWLERQTDLDARTAVVVLSHDMRLDVPALRVALASPAGFVGSLGARRTVARRVELLRDEGVPAEDIARLRSPLGLDLGGSSPEATAVSAMAEILAVRFGGTGAPLRDIEGPIHRDRPLVEAAR
ncbi:XdhC family protein [Microbacterium indicum]|uniref:XdhC family protein n=1 Tax=Microbacterium indicum TaxID=358100 RepID=UPI000423D2D1|nr:XdhC/CoxI family protein [Microbacterium indicum]